MLRGNNNLQLAIDIYENASRDELFAMLENGSVAEKQMSALKLDEVRDAREARIFVSNLVGVDGKVREAVSFRLIEFIAAAPELFMPYHETFLEAIIDINGNVCRNIIQALHALPPECFCAGLIEMTREILQTLPEGNKGYKVNKEVFKLYWCLEAIYEFCEHAPVEILQQTKAVNDYTIREKTAKILTRFDSPELLAIKRELQSDPNYYVRRYQG
jgi:hypothetical protein